MVKSRFIELWNRCQLPDADVSAEAIFAEIEAAYREPHRHYHDCEHIDFCLRQLDGVRNLLRMPRAVELAIWFHDLIYEIGAKDNERRSADRFLALAGPYLPQRLCRKVEAIIMATLHRKPPSDPDTAMLTDIDLSGFGMPWDVFLADNQRVRQEFGHVPDEVYYPAQWDFLQRLLEREHFYSSDYFRSRYEARARANLARYHQQLIEQGRLPATD